MNKYLRFSLNKIHYIDQILFVSLNFIIIFLASEVLSSEEAAFIIWVLSICTLSLTLCTSFVVTPLMIYWYEDKSNQEYFFSASYIAVTAICFIVLSIVYACCHNDSNLNIGFFALTFVLFFTVFDFSRRSMYVLNKHAFSACVSSLTLTVFIISVIWLHYYEAITAKYIFLSGIFAFCFSLPFFLYAQKKMGVLNFPCLSGFKKIFYKQYKYARFSLASAFLIWVVSQGPFTFLYTYIPEKEYIASRVYLSVTGIIGIFFAAFENKVLPSLSESYKRFGGSGLQFGLEGIYSSIIKIIIFGSLISLISILLLFPNVHDFFVLGIFYCLAHSLLGFSKPFLFLAKVKLKQHLMFYVSAVSLCIALISVLYAYTIAPATLAVASYFTFAFIHYILFYSLNQFKRI